VQRDRVDAAAKGAPRLEDAGGGETKDARQGKKDDETSDRGSGREFHTAGLLNDSTRLAGLPGWWG